MVTTKSNRSLFDATDRHPDPRGDGATKRIFVRAAGLLTTHRRLEDIFAFLSCDRLIRLVSSTLLQGGADQR